MVLMQLRIMLMSMAFVTIRATEIFMVSAAPGFHVDICGFCCCWESHWCRQPVWPSGDTLMSVICLWSVCEAILISMSLTTGGIYTDVFDQTFLEGHVDGFSLSFWWKLQRCLWPVLQQMAILIAMVCTTTGDQAEVLGICWCWRSCGYLWFMLSSETM